MNAWPLVLCHHLIRGLLVLLPGLNNTNRTPSSWFALIFLRLFPFRLLGTWNLICPFTDELSSRSATATPLFSVGLLQAASTSLANLDRLVIQLIYCGLSIGPLSSGLKSYKPAIRDCCQLSQTMVNKLQPLWEWLVRLCIPPMLCYRRDCWGSGAAILSF